MRAGAYAEAWACEEAVRASRDPATRDDPREPYHRRWVWDGTPLDGREVLVRCYHGLGDTIQFARFLPWLAERAASVTMEAPSRLIPQLATVTDAVRFVPFDHAAPTRAEDAAVEITELMSALRLPPDTLAVPYMTASRAALPHATVGLCYAAGDWDGERNVPPELLRPICEQATCLSLVAEPTDLPVLNPAGCPFDLGTTASLIAGAALVVTVDTMVAHLAGAMGRPTWLMLKAEPDWRWDPAARGSAWYPTLRLYPQPSSGDWRGAVSAIAHDLDELALDPAGVRRG